MGLIFSRIIYLCYRGIANLVSFGTSEKKNRFDLYDYNCADDPEKNSFLIPHKEWEFESPQKNIDLSKSSDDVFCFGVNAKSEAVAVHISRRADGKTDCSLFLRLFDGRLLVLPREHALQHSSDEEYTFGSSRLKFQCILPMRKWRLFFNGLLEEYQNNVENRTFHHVQMTFLWTAASNVFDFQTDMGKSLLEYNLVHVFNVHQSAKAFRKWVKNTFANYEQPGMLLGTLKVDEEPENEIYLWGARGHYNGLIRGLNESRTVLEIYGNFKYGEVLHLAILGMDRKHFLYGYLMRSDGFIYPFEDLEEQTVTGNGMRFQFKSGNVLHYLSIDRNMTRRMPFKKEFGGATFIDYFDMVLDEMPGRGFMINGNVGAPNFGQVVERESFTTEQNYVLAFNNVDCKDYARVGGKGASLGKLYFLARILEKHGDPFCVPNGVVVTTLAYNEFYDQQLKWPVGMLEQAVLVEPESFQARFNDVAQACNSGVIANHVLEKLSFELLEPLRRGRKFAVRSSALGEDTEQTSAAGQNKTYLGLNTIAQIAIAIKKCWVSQFSFQAVEYRRQHGMDFNTPMAVVVQQMVPCEVAGVAFSCDPVTGNPSFININCNWGLGESVVSSSVDPDVLVVRRDTSDSLTFHSKKIGNKTRKIIMRVSRANENDAGILATTGTETVSLNEEATICCLSEDMAIKISEIAVMLEKRDGTPKDIEWGIIGSRIYLFQSRPVTTLDIDTDFETKHFFDTYLRNETDYLTTANVGEVLPGATSILSMDLFSKLIDCSLTRGFYDQEDCKTAPDFPYYCKRVTFHQNHAMITIIDTLQRYWKDEAISKGTSIAVLGQIFTDIDMLEMGKQRHDAYGKVYKQSALSGLGNLLCIFGLGPVRKYFFLPYERFDKFYMNTTLEKGLDWLGKLMCNYIQAMKIHVAFTSSSTILNSFVLMVLAEAEGDWNNNVYSDFACLLSACTNVESAEVPVAIKELAKSIKRSLNPERFAAMTVDEVVSWLNDTQTDARDLFSEFLSKHGHRCVKEFDTRSETWGSNQTPLIKNLKDLVATDLSDTNERTVPSFSTLVQSLKVEPNAKQRFILKILVHFCKVIVRQREASKSVCIKLLDVFRMGFNEIGENMKNNGFLPEKDLIHFLTIGEIQQLAEKRHTKIINRAIRRRRVLADLDRLKFPPILSGIPVPNNTEEIDASARGYIMTGVSVSQGTAQGIARVVTSLQDAVNIRARDILIAHSTDIGWSPYFPILSGVVTELGGLISHGAVVAREYGLPCIVGVHGATRAFRSGDFVIIDGNAGTIQRIDA